MNFESEEDEKEEGGVGERGEEQDGSGRRSNRRKLPPVPCNPGPEETSKRTKKDGGKAKASGAKGKTSKTQPQKKTGQAPKKPTEPSTEELNYVCQIYTKRPSQAHLTDGLARHGVIISGDSSMDGLHKRKRRFLENFRKKVSNKIEHVLIKKALEFLNADPLSNPQIETKKEENAKVTMDKIHAELESLKKKRKDRDSFLIEECKLFEQMRGLDQDLWDSMGGFDVDILKKTRKFVYNEKESKNAKEKKDMSEAQKKQKRASKEAADKKLFKLSPKLEYVQRVMRPIGGLTKKDNDEEPRIDKRLGFQLVALPPLLLTMLVLELGSPARQSQFMVNSAQICVSAADSSMSSELEGKLKKGKMTDNAKSRIMAAYSQDRRVLKGMTSRHLEEERGGKLASYEEATRLRKEDLDVVDQIVAKAKPLEMVDLPGEDEGSKKIERMKEMLKTFDLSSEWETHVRSRYELDHWFAKASSEPQVVDTNVELDEVLDQGRVPLDSNLLSFHGAAAMGMLQRLVQQAVLNTLEDCEDFDEVEKEGLIEKCVMLSGQIKTGARQIHQEIHIDDR